MIAAVECIYTKQPDAKAHANSRKNERKGFTSEIRYKGQW